MICADRTNTTPSRGLIGLVLILMSAWTTATWAQVETPAKGEEVVWPNTRAGRYAKAFFEAYNTDEKDALRLFMREYHSEAYLKKNPLEKELASHLQLRLIAGKLAVHSAIADGDLAVDVIVRTKIVAWAKFHIELSPEPPHDVCSMDASITSEPNVKPPKQRVKWKDLRDLLQQVHRDSGAPAMAVAVVRGGKVVEKAAAGVRRFDRPDRVEIGDSFHLGSVGKSFTATMIGKLVEEGVLRWDLTISEALHEIPMRSEYRGVTLEQLLQHRGGVPSMPTTGEFAKTTDLWVQRSSAEARVALVRQVLTEEPVKLGEYHYSNSGYVVAGLMAERVAKRSWEELMRTLVFEPLGLQSAGFGWPATRDCPNQPHGHLGTPPGFSVQEPGEHPLLGDMDYMGPAGNLHCSMPDLGRFAAFHLQGLQGQHSLLKADTVRRLHTPPGDGFTASGWEIRETDEGEPFHEHTGTGLSFYVWIAIYPERDLGIVLAANCGLPAKPFLRKIKDAIYRRMKQGPRTPVETTDFDERAMASLEQDVKREEDGNRDDHGSPPALATDNGQRPGPCRKGQRQGEPHAKSAEADSRDCPIDLPLARQCFREARALSDKEGGRLWGKSLYGPFIFGDMASRVVVANQADAQGHLTERGGVWVGTLPPEENMANTSTDWAGVKWTMVIWPPPPDHHSRGWLFTHELFHRIQHEVGLPSGAYNNEHLDTLEGRIWLRLEWRALQQALTSTGTNRRAAIEDALVFRRHRQALYPERVADECGLEMHEGMAEYTGFMAGGLPPEEKLDRLVRHIASFERSENLLRNFAYASGPAYGVLLDLAGAKWRAGLSPKTDLGTLLMSTCHIQLPVDLATEATERSTKYDGDCVVRQEKRRDEKRKHKNAKYKALFIDNPTLSLPVAGRTNFSFDPRLVVTFDKYGTVYPTLRVTDSWGVIEVTRQDGGALMIKDKEGVLRKFLVSAPLDATARPLTGEGWILELEDGWTLKRGKRACDYVVARDSN